MARSSNRRTAAQELLRASTPAARPGRAGAGNGSARGAGQGEVPSPVGPASARTRLLAGLRPGRRGWAGPGAGSVPWLDPYPVGLDATFEQRESLELAFVAALQHLPAAQRAVLILREVLEFSAVETAELLDTSVPAVNSALQRAKGAVSARVPPLSQQATLAQLGDAARQALVQAYVNAWAQQDSQALVALLTEDVRFTMPPIPSWFNGREAVVRFFTEPVFRSPWRLEPTWACGQLAFAAYQAPHFRLGALNVVALRAGRIAEITGFLDPAVQAFFSLRGR